MCCGYCDEFCRQDGGIGRKRHADKPGCQTFESREELACVLGIDQAADDRQRFRIACLQAVDKSPQRARRMGIMAAVEPEFRSGVGQGGMERVRL